MQYCTIFSAVCLFCLVITSQPFPVKEEISPVVRSDVAPILFTEQIKGHIDFQYERQVHGDKFAFNGLNTKLVQAFFSQLGGNVHFYDGEQRNKTESADPKDGTAPTPEVELSRLAPDTTDGSIDTENGTSYLIESSTGIYSSTPNTNDAPDVCQDSSIDTATQTQNGDSYFFKGDFYWRVLDDKIADGYPRKIKDDWNGLEGNLDASFTSLDGNTYFFKGKWHWKFINKEIYPDYPRLISLGFKGIPDNLDAAFVWGINKNPHFFKGDNYWVFDSQSDPPVLNIYPQPISKWPGLPNNIDAAFHFENNRLYFFKDDVYYRFDDKEFKVETQNPPYPRYTSTWWFFCAAKPQGTS